MTTPAKKHTLWQQILSTKENQVYKLLLLGLF